RQHPVLAQQVSDPVHDRTGLARAGTCQNQGWALEVPDSSALFVVEGCQQLVCRCVRMFVFDQGLRHSVSQHTAEGTGVRVTLHEVNEAADMPPTTGVIEAVRFDLDGTLGGYAGDFGGLLALLRSELMLQQCNMNNFGAIVQEELRR